MLNDVLIILYWWSILLFLGMIFLPFTFKVFHIFNDRGYAFSKIISVAIISYAAWIGGELKIFSFSFANIWLVILLLGGINLYLPKKDIKEFFGALRDKRRIIVFEECLFLAALLAAAIIRGFEPRIEGLEKFMDFG